MSEYIEKILNSEISCCKEMLENYEEIESPLISEACRARVVANWKGSLDTAVKIREKLSGEDIESVVRCKDCIYNNRISCPLCYVEKHDLCFIQHDPDFYCAKGRKEGEKK